MSSKISFLSFEYEMIRAYMSSEFIRTTYKADLNDIP